MPGACSESLLNHRFPRPAGLLLGAVAVTVTVAGCGGGGSYSSSGGATTQPNPASSAGASSSAAAGGTSVTVSETEYKISLNSSTFRAGAYNFVADDKGQATHALTIEGPGIEEQSTKTLAPSQSATLSVTLQKGTYELYCPVDGHKQMGMDTHITVS